MAERQYYLNKGVFFVYYNKRNQEEVEKVETSVYVCQAPDCNVWMRKEFVTQNLHCPICGSEMKEEVWELYPIKKN